MRVVVDLDVCEANGLCVLAAPEVFELDDADELRVLLEDPPEALRPKVELAVKRCPMQAISIDG